MSKRAKYFYIWLFTAFLMGLPILTSYVFVQQEARSEIDVPLIQILQSVRAELQGGVDPNSILKSNRIDLSTSQSPFITLYSLDKKVLGSNEHLGNQTLTLPPGVLNTSRVKGENRVTWQPTSTLRFASVTDYLPNFGYVSVSESLQEVESRAMRSLLLGLVALAFGSILSGLGILWYARYWDKQRS